jgi:hypothetical protein
MGEAGCGSSGFWTAGPRARRSLGSACVWSSGISSSSSGSWRSRVVRFVMAPVTPVRAHARSVLGASWLKRFGSHSDLAGRVTPERSRNIRLARPVSRPMVARVGGGAEPYSLSGSPASSAWSISPASRSARS